MTWLIDGVAFIGGGLITAGFYLLLGLPAALIVGGSFLLGMAVYAARNYEGADVSDS
jgi:membrane protein implicated in regulation of membrane protease activity